MSSQAHDLHRALLRPFILHTLRAAGFHSTKPSVLDTLTNLAERHMMLLASSTAQHAWSSHNDPVPTITDTRMALTDAGILFSTSDASEESWKERMRKPLSELEMAIPHGGLKLTQAMKRKRDEEDLKDVKDFVGWYDSAQYREIKRVAGIVLDEKLAVGVGGGVMQGDDFFTALKKKHSKAGDDARLQGTVLGRTADDRGFSIEGGEIRHLRDWRPKLEERVVDPGQASGRVTTQQSDTSVGEVAPGGTVAVS